MLEDIEKFIDSEIRPYMNSHGGDIEIVSLKDGILRLKFTGACFACPTSMATFDEIVSGRILPAFEELKDVLLINDVDQSMLDMAKKILEHKL